MKITAVTLLVPTRFPGLPTSYESLHATDGFEFKVSEGRLYVRHIRAEGVMAIPLASNVRKYELSGCAWDSIPDEIEPVIEPVKGAKK